ncbi:Arc family DNA-binding protein [Periweissella beninensis]|uniref:Arc family DNA-binding protein n=1 Tax=Periweissella beninensis TaxID=504936 RepID=UPI0021A449F7|nr:Arc family DNA-binding protein [Periweissella beninensis]
MSDEKRFLLRLSQDLYDQISELAQKDHRSVNSYIVNLLDQQLPVNNFEDRHVLKQIINGATLDLVNNLILINGIYYRFKTDNNDRIDSTANYCIVATDGNLLTLQKI